jgi:hypothetical protein
MVSTHIDGVCVTTALVVMSEIGVERTGESVFRDPRSARTSSAGARAWTNPRRSRLQRKNSHA